MIAIPSGYYVKMQMISDSSSSNPTKVTPYIKAVRIEAYLKDFSCLSYKVHEVRIFTVTKLSKAANVPYRCNQQVSVRVWESVKEDNSFCITIEQEIVFI